MHGGIAPENVDIILDEYGAQIPEHVILRLAEFVLKKMREEKDEK